MSNEGKPVVARCWKLTAASGALIAVDVPTAYGEGLAALRRDPQYVCVDASEEIDPRSPLGRAIKVSGDV
jgi:hypothetical protein